MRNASQLLESVDNLPNPAFSVFQPIFSYSLVVKSSVNSPNVCIP